MKRNSLYILLCLFSLSIGKAQFSSPDNSAIARAGAVFISEHEFLERYELLPWQYRNRANNVEESKIVFLYSLVAEKLLAQEAIVRHIDQDSMFLDAVSGIKKILARDQLYREEVSGKVTVSREEVRRSIIDAKRKFFLSFLFFEDSTDAAFVRKQLKDCRQFNSFRLDTSMAALRDTATLVWGEAEAPIENAAFHLHKGECSPVVRASAGYYILHVDKEVTNTFYSSMQPQVLFERVEIKLRLRKENARLDEYLIDVLKTKTGFSLPRPFKAVARILTDVWKNETPSSEKMITDSLLEILYGRCRSILQDSMVVVGSHSWTVGDVLVRLRGKVFTIDPRRTTGIAAQLNNQIRILVGQELLAEEALSRKLDERWSVTKELDIWRQQLLAKYEELEVQRNVQVTDQEVIQYLSETHAEIQFPRVQIRELHTKDIRSMEEALKELNAGTKLDSVIHAYSSDASTVHNNGISEPFAINERFPLGVLAWRMKNGERHGPVKVNEDYLYFELLKKEMPAGMTDSAFVSSMQRAASAARRLKQKKTLDIVIAKSAQQRGYDIYTDRLKLLKVSHVPMMTYRILGFGGRMFAAPFVTRQVDWMDIENPEKIPLP